jgi:hypothetical protein
VRTCNYLGGCEVVTQRWIDGKWQPALGPFCSRHNTPEKRRAAAARDGIAASQPGHTRRSQ